ncbi:MAG: hypothetical protein Q8P31_03350 [Bacillota bacterium]|nr:hypothetical protein [Bacillota bacterium]
MFVLPAGGGRLITIGVDLQGAAAPACGTGLRPAQLSFLKV